MGCCVSDSSCVSSCLVPTHLRSRLKRGLYEGRTKQPKTAVVANWVRTECDSLSLPQSVYALINDYGAALIDSNILSVNEFADLRQRAQTECGVDLSNSSLLFRGSDDGFDSQKFHELCDRKGATLTVVQTEFGHVIGGVTLREHMCPPYYAGRDDTDAFLFVSRVSDAKRPQYAGIRLPAILKANPESKLPHICCHEENGPMFGHYLWIRDQCHDDARSFCDDSVDAFSSVCDGVTLSSFAITGGNPLFVGQSRRKSAFRVLDYEVFVCNQVWVQSDETFCVCQLEESAKQPKEEFFLQFGMSSWF